MVRILTHMQTNTRYRHNLKYLPLSNKKCIYNHSKYVVRKQTYNKNAIVSKATPIVRTKVSFNKMPKNSMIIFLMYLFIIKIQYVGFVTVHTFTCIIIHGHFLNIWDHFVFNVICVHCLKPYKIYPDWCNFGFMINFLCSYRAIFI